jgi:hypothetical protein
MRGEDQSTGKMFSYVSAERRIPADHPLRPMRALVDEALKELIQLNFSEPAKGGR